MSDEQVDRVVRAIIFLEIIVVIGFSTLIALVIVIGESIHP